MKNTYYVRKGGSGIGNVVIAYLLLFPLSTVAYAEDETDIIKEELITQELNFIASCMNCSYLPLELAFGGA